MKEIRITSSTEDSEIEDSVVNSEDRQISDEEKATWKRNNARFIELEITRKKAIRDTLKAREEEEAKKQIEENKDTTS